MALLSPLFERFHLAHDPFAMACVTLKRPLPLEHPFENGLVSNSPHQRPPCSKRRRFLDGEDG